MPTMAGPAFANGSPIQLIYDFSALQMSGEALPLAQFKGRPLLIVNTASQCMFTPQYAGLEQLHRRYSDQGLVVLGFPCNQFGAQEPGSDAQIASFCQSNYDVSFPIMAKVDVNGDAASPLWKWLTGQVPGLLGSTSVKWNFTKFLVARNGASVKRYAPIRSPRYLARDIEAALTA